MSQLFRINKIAPAADYKRVVITAQWHEDEWYTNAWQGRPDPLKSTRSRDKLARPSFPWAPYQIQPQSGDPLFPRHEWSFGVQVAAAEDGTYSNIAVTGREPLNDVSASLDPPFVARQGTMSSGGNLLGGGFTYCFVVCGVDSDGKLTSPSGVCQCSSYAPGTYKATVPVLSWPSGTASWHLFGGLSAQSMTWQASGTGTPSSIDCSAYNEAAWGCPDTEFDSLEIAIKREVHGGVWGAEVNAVATRKLTFVGAGVGVDWTGRVVSLVAKRDGPAVPLLSFRVASNTNDDLTIDSGSPDPAAAGIAPGDVFLMRSSGCTITGLTITDARWENPVSNAGAGLAVGAEKGNWLRVIAGAGDGYHYRIADNTATSITIEGPWIQTPDSTSVFVVEEPNWLPDSGELAQPNNSDPSAVVTLQVPVRNYAGSTLLVMAFTRDGGGKMPPEQMCPFREIYISQSASLLKSEITVTHAMSPYAMGGSIQFVHCDTSGGDIVINLSAASTLPLDFYAIDKATSDANTATINAAAGESFPEGTSIVLSAQNGQPGGQYTFAPKH